MNENLDHEAHNENMSSDVALIERLAFRREQSSFLFI